MRAPGTVHRVGTTGSVAESLESPVGLASPLGILVVKRVRTTNDMVQTIHKPTGEAQTEGK